MATIQFADQGRTIDIPDEIFKKYHDSFSSGASDAITALTGAEGEYRKSLGLDVPGVNDDDNARVFENLSQEQKVSLNTLGLAKQKGSVQNQALEAALKGISFADAGLQAKAPGSSSTSTVPKREVPYVAPARYVILPNGQEVNYDIADATTKAAADAGTYKTRQDPGQGTAPAGLPPLEVNRTPQVGHQNIYNPSTGQKGFQVEGVPPPPGWLPIPAGGVPGSSGAAPATATVNAAPGTTPQSTVATQGATAVEAPTTPLQPGATGPAVKALQDYLVSLGLMTPAQVATGPGIYGPQTTAAVRALQEKLGVDSSSGPGYFGPRTISALQNSGASSSNPGGSSDGSSNPGSSLPTGETTGSGVDSLAGILSGVGIQLNPQTSLTDMVKELSTLYGFDDINGELKALDDKYVKDVANVNDDPWISEGIRTKRIEKLKNSYDESKKLYTERLALKGDLIGKAISLYNAEKSDEQQLLMKALEFKLNAIKPNATTDITEYNLAKTQGYKGSFLDWQKQSANLKTPKPSTTVINTGAASSAEEQLLASRNQGPDADGLYADPNLYASLRAKSTLGAAEFDRRFDYLVNPASKARLGIKAVKTGVDYSDF